MANRESVIDGLEWILSDDRFGFGVNWERGEPRDDYEKAGKIITDALTMLKEQHPKTGHWEVLTMCANEGTYCSVCHTKIFDFVHPPKKKLSQYCPHCGTRMEGQAVK